MRFFGGIEMKMSVMKTLYDDLLEIINSQQNALILNFFFVLCKEYEKL